MMVGFWIKNGPKINIFEHTQNQPSRDPKLSEKMRPIRGSPTSRSMYPFWDTFKLSSEKGSKTGEFH